MNKYSRVVLFASLFQFTTLLLHAQAPFQDEIKTFKKEDSSHFPGLHKILFVGSSSFNFWKDVQDYFPNHPIINRGFGGSSLPDVIRYANEIIFPYRPKQIVIYCGDNDLAASDSVTAQTVEKRFKELFFLIRKKIPGVPIVFVSIKPSPSRAYLMPRMVQTNQLIKQFLAHQKKAVYIDVYHKMLLPDGKPIPEIFKQDSLHMNPKGYAIWKKAIGPHLK